MRASVEAWTWDANASLAGFDESKLEASGSHIWPPGLTWVFDLNSLSRSTHVSHLSRSSDMGVRM